MLLPGPSPAIHAALCSSSTLLSLLSSGGSLPCLRWWQVPSEVFNHLSCKTPFNWNYPLADKLLELYQGEDIVVRVFHCFHSFIACSIALSLIVFLCLQFLPPVCLFLFSKWTILTVHSLFFATLCSPSQALCPVLLPIQGLLLLLDWNILNDPVSTFFLISYTALWTVMQCLSCCEPSGVTG